MRDAPSAAELLETARAAEAQGDPSRYEQLMIAAARDIVARERAAGDAALRVERAALAQVYGDVDAPLEDALILLNRRFAADIRAGKFDDDARALDILRAATEAKLAECNPRYPRKSPHPGPLPPEREREQ
jgi:hypothetical protein